MGYSGVFQWTRVNYLHLYYRVTNKIITYLTLVHLVHGPTGMHSMVLATLYSNVNSGAYTINWKLLKTNKCYHLLVEQGLFTFNGILFYCFEGGSPFDSLVNLCLFVSPS